MSATQIDDPFALVEEAAKKQAVEEALISRIGKATRTLIFNPGKARKDSDSVFWATLALKFSGKNMVIDYTIDTAATDGKRLYCNPDFFATLSDAEVLGVLVHEVAHCALNHHGRIQHRQIRRSNIAADLAENYLLEGAGFTLPKGALRAGKPPFEKIDEGMSFEATYSKLEGEGDPGDGKDGDDPGGCGGVRRPGDGSEADAAMSKAEWEIAVAQASQVARMRGAVSAGLDRLIAEVLHPVVDWKHVLQEFVSTKAKTDYRWSPPNRRFASSGLYLPARSGMTIGLILVTMDESGSMSDRNMAEAGGELNGIFGAFDNVRVIVLHHDTEVVAVEEWTNSDGPFVLTRKACGGTSHKCITAWLDENDVEPACVVAFTDLCTDFPDDPGIPWLWATTAKGTKAPWGTTVEICQ